MGGLGRDEPRFHHILNQNEAKLFAEHCRRTTPCKSDYAHGAPIPTYTFLFM